MYFNESNGALVSQWISGKIQSDQFGVKRTIRVSERTTNATGSIGSYSTMTQREFDYWISLSFDQFVPNRSPSSRISIEN